MEPTQWWGQGFGFMWLLPLLFFVVMAFIMRSFFGRGSSSCGSHGDSNNHQENAREILDNRFAKGEINSDEYEDMKKELKK